ncbi:universal stress protein [Streptacidiphilus monticola]|uniref:Universal stress protein n=1 Tax=Streptacidiphilus monticola TaxID=2161674 RepID=A0ABW1GCD1_9ACTN
MFQRILVAIDGGPNRHQALATARELATLTGSRVRVVHVLASAVAFDTLVRLEDDPEAHAVLDEAVTTLRSAGIDADGELFLGLTDQVPAVISEAAAQFQADLVVLSPHHRGAVAAFFNHRVSDTVAHTSRIAVLLAPEAAAESAGR